jgi:nucleoside-diphosphate-sugar epimerase
MKILVTGANGFVGKSLCPELLRQGQFIHAAVRSADIQVENSEAVLIGKINGETDWTDALRNIKIVVHLAGRAHFLKGTAIDNLAEFRKVNVEGTLNLARQAVKAGVQRFIFISSIKVNGEVSLLGHPFTVEDEPAPIDAYGISSCVN